MSWYDIEPQEMTSYRPDVPEPADFDEFWAASLAESRAVAPSALVDAQRVGGTGRYVVADDVTLAGYAGDPVRAWYLRPADATGPLPCVVEYSAYGCGRGLPLERLVWPNMGYTYLFVDARGQGSGWGSGGATGDPHGSGPASGGFLTRGIESRDAYYYRRLFVDAARAVDAAAELPGVDRDRIAVTGASQGGATAIAAAALSPAVTAVMADVPFLCHIRRAVGLVDTEPYVELARYLAVHRHAVERTFDVLSYFDTVNFARRVKVPALLSTALMDELCPPSTVFAAANHMPGCDRVEVYPFNDHDGGGFHHLALQIDWLARHFHPEA